MRAMSPAARIMKKGMYKNDMGASVKNLAPKSSMIPWKVLSFDQKTSIAMRMMAIIKQNTAAVIFHPVLLAQNLYYLSSTYPIAPKSEPPKQSEPKLPAHGQLAGYIGEDTWIKSTRYIPVQIQQSRPKSKWS
jgi:hypothetical protein